MSKRCHPDHIKPQDITFFDFLTLPVFVKRLAPHKTPIAWDGGYSVGLHQTGQVLPVIGNNAVAGATCLSTKPSDPLDGHLLLSAWDDKDAPYQYKLVYILHERGCPVAHNKKII